MSEEAASSSPVENRKENSLNSSSDTSASTLTVTNDGVSSSETNTIDLEKMEKLVLEDGDTEKGEEEKSEPETSSDVKEHQIADDYVDEEALKVEEEKLTPEEIAVRPYLMAQCFDFILYILFSLITNILCCFLVTGKAIKSQST